MVHEKKAPSSGALCGRSSSTSPQVAVTRVVMRCNEALAACDQHEHTATSHPPHMRSKYFGSSKHQGKSSVRLVYCGVALAKETKKGDRLVPPGSLNRSGLSQTGVLAVSHTRHNPHTHTKNLLTVCQMSRYKILQGTTSSPTEVAARAMPIIE